MLPFLKHKDRTVGGISTEYRKPDEKPEHEEGADEGHEEALEACAADLIRGVHSDDKKTVVAALRSAFEILDALPHEEGEHIGEESEGEEE